MSDQHEVKRTLTFARDLADPDWSLSVPRPAKVVISQLAAAVEAALALADETDSHSLEHGRNLEDDDFDRGWHGARREYAERIREVIENALKP